MKVLLTGGGSGGHFYPLIAVAEALHKEAEEKKLVDIKLYYMAPEPYDKGLLFDNQITFVKIRSGKMRRYFSIANFFDLMQTGWGIITGLFTVFFIYPDVIFSKGGMVSFPAVIAAKILRIPLFIHESDSTPGRANLWASKFATRIAVSFPDAGKYFKGKEVAFTGNPIRRELLLPQNSGAHQYLQLENNLPVILVLGGSLGSELINEIVINSLASLVEKYQIIHQTGKGNFKESVSTAKILLENSPFKNRYHPFEYLNTLAMKMSSGIANLVVSRAGSTLFEIAAWNTPSIIIPITDSNGDHQRKNAYAYAESGACIVIEEANLNSNILVQEINRILSQSSVSDSMKKAAQAFARPDSAKLIADEIIRIGLSHEK